jgi:hypothetical protein
MGKKLNLGQRERLGKLLGRWGEKSYTWPKLGIPVEIHFLLRKVP